MRRTSLVIATGVCLGLSAVANVAAAAYREPKGVFALFPRGLVKRIAMPGQTEGYMFKTFRQPILIAGKEISHLVVLTNGVDHKTWSFATILGVVLRNYCGIRDSGFAANLIKKAQGSAPIAVAAVATARAAAPLRRASAVASKCKVTVEIKGNRQRKVTATFGPEKASDN